MRLYRVEMPIYESEPEGAPRDVWFSNKADAWRCYRHWAEKLDENEADPEREDFHLEDLELDLVEIADLPKKQLILRALNRDKFAKRVENIATWKPNSNRAKTRTYTLVQVYDPENSATWHYAEYSSLEAIVKDHPDPESHGADDFVEAHVPGGDVIDVFPARDIY